MVIERVQYACPEHYCIFLYLSLLLFFCLSIVLSSISYAFIFILSSLFVPGYIITLMTIHIA